MKAIITLAICALLATASAFISMQPTTVTLAWNSPGSVDAFYVYQSQSITNPMPWTPFTNTAGTNLQVTVQVMPGQSFYYVTASNFWGESGSKQRDTYPANPIGY